ncbi:hypothetical protein BN946_scf184951.g22 [Trametes cinnabarina]|uniref:Uncharacterized protein n=1 Tax=Pycnoporus cinnabarinus TaxID=5643 RepID=A0A060SUG1_PYCCI|nr:hypothetical protein BN946_scf184951.g22 [Trametes cinnabarina]
MHKELPRKNNSVHPLVLRATRRPHPHRPIELSPLPEKPVPAYTLTTPTVRPARFRESRAPTASQNGRRKWRTMHANEELSEEEESSIPLADLPHLDLQHVPEVIVRRRPLEPMMQQSRPQNMVVPPIRAPDPPVSIGYSAFARRFVELERAGIIDGTGLWPSEKAKTTQGSEDGGGRGNPESSKKQRSTEQ